MVWTAQAVFLLERGCTQTQINRQRHRRSWSLYPRFSCLRRG